MCLNPVDFNGIKNPNLLYTRPAVLNLFRSRAQQLCLSAAASWLRATVVLPQRTSVVLNWGNGPHTSISGKSVVEGRGEDWEGLQHEPGLLPALLVRKPNEIPRGAHRALLLGHGSTHTVTPRGGCMACQDAPAPPVRATALGKRLCALLNGDLNE